jgi:hypothetical protein
MPVNRKLTFVAVYILLIFSSIALAICPSKAADEEPYQLSCSITFNPSSPHQTEVLTVSVDIENLGGTTFNGQEVIDMETDTHTFSPEVIQIDSIANGDIWHEDIPYRADDEGIWWVTVTIEEQNHANISLYDADWSLQQEGESVQYTDSIYVMSLGNYNQQQSVKWTQIGIIVSIIVAAVTVTGTVIGIRRRRKEHQTPA